MEHTWMNNRDHPSAHRPPRCLVCYLSKRRLVGLSVLTISLYIYTFVLGRAAPLASLQEATNRKFDCVPSLALCVAA
jgi:hypothetical protein